MIPETSDTGEAVQLEEANQEERLADPTEWIARRLQLPEDDRLVKVAVLLKKRGLVQARIIQETFDCSEMQAHQYIKRLEEKGMIDDHPEFGKRIRWVTEHIDMPKLPTLHRR